MHPLLASLLAARPALLDGSWGTQLQERGLPLGACPDAWNLTHQDRVAAVARAYADAGSAVVLTNTFGASPRALRRHGLDARAREINVAGARLSVDGVGGRARVFGSIGPSGALVATGEVAVAELEDGFAVQAEALREGGVDGLVVETMTDLDEARAAVRAARRTGLPVAACMVFDAGRDRDRTMMGTTIEQAAAGLEDAGADAIGSNCGRGAATMLPICRRLRAATRLPLWIKPNAGLPELVDGRAVYATTPDEFAEQLAALVAGGADLVGGCCGTTPAFVAAAARRLRGDA